MMRLRPYQAIAACCFCVAAAADLAPMAAAQPAPAAVLDNPVATLSLDHLEATRERPLFAPSRHRRQPVVLSVRQPPPPPPAPPAPPPKIELHGTIVNADQALAIILSPTDNQTLLVHLGDEIAGWKVTEIDERKLVLTLDNRTAEYAIFVDKSTNDASAPSQEPQPDQPTPSPPRPRASLTTDDLKQQ